MQGTIDFTAVLHTRENNPESEAQLREHKFHFTGQCAYVLSLLQKGERLTTRDAMLKHGIGHLPRRIADLKQAGVGIECAYMTDGDGNKTRFKEYFLTMSKTSIHYEPPISQQSLQSLRKHTT